MQKTLTRFIDGKNWDLLKVLISSLLLIFFLIGLCICTIDTVKVLFSNFSLMFENTAGEAGKVYYALRYINDQSLFVDGRTPPYYPSFHGVLLPLTVGFLGKLFSLDIYELFIAGRTLSLIFTFFSLFLILLILRKLRLHWIWLVVSCLMFFAPFQLVQHTTSFRADNWVLFLSLMSFYLLMKDVLSGYDIALLVVIPIVAFFLKATGLSISVCITGAFLANKRYKLALLYLALVASLMLISVLAVEVVSQGSFSQAFLNGMRVGLTYQPLWYLWNHKEVFAILVLPFFLLRPVFLLSYISNRILKTLFLFWFISLVFNCLFLLRVGSWLYYVLESYTYALLIFVLALDVVYSKNKAKEKHMPYRGYQILVSFYIIYITYILFSTPQFLSTNNKEYGDFNPDRIKLAQFINMNNLKSFSDDPNLNIRLRAPAVIYPKLQSIFIKSGFLTQDSLYLPIKQMNYDIIVLSLINRPYLGIDNLPAEFIDYAYKYYEQGKIANMETKYIILVPRKNL